MSLSIVFLITALVFNATANILLKVGAGRVSSLEGLSLLDKGLALLSNLPLVLGLILFASNVAFYFLALRAIRISVAYPIMTGGGLAIITIASYFFLREQIDMLQTAGIVLIAAGIVMVASRMG
ncbi:MAG: hypothetical protein K1X75_01720 [Leptospirales bacterium]|nr:hypothetical protein [Leptospirales bacterium]